jgi:tripartite-type tricarboxylate transporter receptor subunit TctC
MRRREFACQLAALSFLWAGVTPSSFSLQARADEWPSHAIRIIVPFGAGGAGDTLARIVAQHLSESLGQPFVVEDRPGAGGILGTQQIVTAAPDGYTIGITKLSTLSLIPVINPEATYKPLRDLKHIAYIGGSSFLQPMRQPTLKACMTLSPTPVRPDTPLRFHRRVWDRMAT